MRLGGLEVSLVLTHDAQAAGRRQSPGIVGAQRLLSRIEDRVGQGGCLVQPPLLSPEDRDVPAHRVGLEVGWAEAFDGVGEVLLQ